jgi:hypothetical protein
MRDPIDPTAVILIVLAILVVTVAILTRASEF